MAFLLSVCIPTYNRANLLDDLLNCLAKECRYHQDEVEVVVRDNFSTDHTYEIVNKHSSKLNLKYVKNTTNVGIASNIYGVPDLSQGRYCWILGDDDLIAPGSIARLLDLIKSKGEFEGYVVAYSYEPLERRKTILQSQSVIKFSAPIFGNDKSEGALDQWESTLMFSEVPGLQTSIVSCVFNREKWLQTKKELNLDLNVEPLTSLASTFPHTMVWARMFVGRPCYLIPEPMILFCLGAQDWFQLKWSTIMFTFCLQLAQFMRAEGADSKAIDYYENVILRSDRRLYDLLMKPNDYSKQLFSFGDFIESFGHRKALRQSLQQICQHGRLKKRMRTVVTCFREGRWRPRLWGLFILLCWVALFPKKENSVKLSH